MTDPIIEVYEKFKHLDKIPMLSDPDWWDRTKPQERMAHELWMAIKQHAEIMDDRIEGALYNSKGDGVSMDEVVAWWLKNYEGLEHLTEGGTTSPETWFTINTILRRCFNKIKKDEKVN